MGIYLGIDTSNYTTSAALYDADSGDMRMQKKLLPVRENSIGLKQSDAVFAHVKQLGGLIEALFTETTISPDMICGIGVSCWPRRLAGSYMPCFLTGEMAAQAVAGVLRVPLFRFSHQEGHIAAALYSAGRLDLLQKECIAFHVSGGTTDCLLVSPGQDGCIEIFCAASSLDLKAGQAIDRIGVKMGLHFPAGPELEQLALQWTGPVKVYPVIKGADCCLSGLENQCLRMLENGKSREETACYCIRFIQATLEKMLEAVLRQYGERPIIFAGGVMSNRMIRQYFSQKYGALFAQPQYSADNAAGIAVLAAHGINNTSQTKPAK